MTHTVTVLYDNESTKPGLKPDWGFAALVRTLDGQTVLFDTGADGRILAHNASLLRADLSSLSAVVISHWHWDHSGGLPIVLREAVNAHLYVPGVASEHVPSDRLHVVERDPVEVVPGVYSTGVAGSVEQALVLETGWGGFVVMGCAHPGVTELLVAAGRVTKPYALLGGLHGFSELSALETLNAIYPCHCTQRKRDILEKYPARARPCGAGLVVNV